MHTIILKTVWAGASWCIQTLASACVAISATTAAGTTLIATSNAVRLHTQVAVVSAGTGTVRQ